MDSSEIIKRIQSLSDPDAVKGMARFGINSEKNFGVSVTELRAIARTVGKNHELAMDLWGTGIRDARLLATIVANPKKLTESQAEEMVTGIDSWDVCDGFCMNLVRHADFAYDKAAEWCSRESEFEKRAGFSLIATLAVHGKRIPDSEFIYFIPFIMREAADDRNYVKKAVSWALRSIGKRNMPMNRKAVKVANKLSHSPYASARWIGSDALRELESEPVQRRLARK